MIKLTMSRVLPFCELFRLRFNYRIASIYQYPVPTVKRSPGQSHQISLKSSPYTECRTCFWIKALEEPPAGVERGSVKTPVLHDGVFQAKPLSTDTNSVYLFLLD